MKRINNRQDLELIVNKIISSVTITDIHTHLFSECFGKMFLYGIDELLTYHYLIAETMRHIDMDYNFFF